MEKFDPAIHDDNPPINAEFMARMNPSTRGRGRPPLDNPKVAVKLRLDAKTVAHLRNRGDGWHSRINAVLSEAIAAGRI